MYVVRIAIVGVSRAANTLTISFKLDTPVVSRVANGMIEPNKAQSPGSHPCLHFTNSGRFILHQDALRKVRPDQRTQGLAQVREAYGVTEAVIEPQSKTKCTLEFIQHYLMSGPARARKIRCESRRHLADA